METKTNETTNQPVKTRQAAAALNARAFAPAGINEVAVSRLILFLAMAAGTFMRIWQINAMGYNTDEAVYAGQAAAISGVSGLKDMFPIFRAHPLLVPF